MFIFFYINKNFTNYKIIIIHNYINGINCNPHKCSSIKNVAQIRYLGIYFINNFRWNLHIHNLVGK